MNSMIRRVAAISVLLLTIGAMPAFSQVRTGMSAGQFRVIRIVSVPDATVWVDGVRFGKTGADGKLEVRTISTGGHSLRVRADGYNERVLTLAPAQKGEIRADLTKTSDAAELAFQEAERLTLVDREKAIEAYKRAIKLRPAYPDAFVALARVQSETGDLEDAERAIASARKLRPAFAEASAVLGRIYKDLGQEDKAIAAFERAITEGKGFQPEALAGLGLLFKEKAEGFGGSGEFEDEQANYAEAAKYLQRSVKQISGAPDAVVIYQLLGLVYERMQKYQDAIAVYEEFLRIFPDSAESTAIRSFIVQLKKQSTNDR